MPGKDPGRPKIHRLRVIHLYELDYNLYLAVKWRALVRHAVKVTQLLPLTPQVFDAVSESMEWIGEYVLSRGEHWQRPGTTSRRNLASATNMYNTAGTHPGLALDKEVATPLAIGFYKQYSL